MKIRIKAISEDDYFFKHQDKYIGLVGEANGIKPYKDQFKSLWFVRPGYKAPIFFLGVTFEEVKDES